MKRRVFGFLALALGIVLAACSGGTDYVGVSESSTTPAVDSYTVTISDSITNGTVTASKTSAASGEEITLTVTPSDGYALDLLTVKDVGGSDVTVTASKFIMPAKNVTVSAVFKVATVTYSVTVDGAITGGTVTADKTTGIPAGSMVTLTITPATGKVLNALTVTASGSPVATTAVVAGTTYTFAMPEGNVSVTATFKAATLGSKAAPDAVGDIVFNDGSAEAYSDSLTLTAEQIAGAVAVIFDVSGSNKKGVGLKLGTSLKWAASSTTGYTMNISTLAATDTSGSNATDAVFSGAGATDGSGSLEKLKAAVSDYSSTNYPAWDFVENYATTAGLTGTYASGWYMPSIAELCKLYQAKETVNNTLNKITVATQISASNYWSSSQVGDDVASDVAWYVRFWGGELIEVGNGLTKSSGLSVCVVRTF